MRWNRCRYGPRRGSCMNVDRRGRCTIRRGCWRVLRWCTRRSRSGSSRGEADRRVSCRRRRGCRRGARSAVRWRRRIERRHSIGMPLCQRAERKRCPECRALLELAAPLLRQRQVVTQLVHQRLAGRPITAHWRIRSPTPPYIYAHIHAWYCSRVPFVWWQLELQCLAHQLRALAIETQRLRELHNQSAPRV